MGHSVDRSQPSTSVTSKRQAECTELANTLIEAQKLSKRDQHEPEAKHSRTQSNQIKNRRSFLRLTIQTIKPS